AAAVEVVGARIQGPARLALAEGRAGGGVDDTFGGTQRQARTKAEIDAIRAAKVVAVTLLVALDGSVAADLIAAAGRVEGAALGAGQGAAHEAEGHAALAGEIITVTGLVRRLDVAVAAVHPAAGLVVVVVVVVAGLGIADLVAGLLGPGLGLAAGPGVVGLFGRLATASRERTDHHQHGATRYRVH